MNKEVVLLAHNIRSLWNVGSLFRTSDAFGVSKLILTGYTALPPRREISKTALGAEETVSWEHHQEPINIIQELKKQGVSIVALELTEDATDLSEYKSQEKICLIVGHEVSGVPKDLLDLCDEKVQIPMQGKKESLNVAVATGVALFQITK
jgi:23S rRNA (guanosine2251-2'-O)-methyltransferase